MIANDCRVWDNSVRISHPDCNAGEFLICSVLFRKHSAPNVSLGDLAFAKLDQHQAAECTAENLSRELPFYSILKV